MEFERNAEAALEQEFVPKTLGVEMEGKRAEGLGIALRELEDVGRKRILEDLAILREQGEIDDEAIHGVNVD